MPKPERLSKPTLAAACVALIVLAGCPGPKPIEACEDGNLQSAANTFSAFLVGNRACTSDDAGESGDAGCMLVQNPCNLVDSCNFVQVAVGASHEAAAEELASTLDAEKCPASCNTELGDELIEPPQIQSGNQCTTSAAGALSAACVAGACTVILQPFLDAGLGPFESRCHFDCTDAQFCDVSPFEVPCPGAPGVVTLTSGDGVCASLAPGDVSEFNTCTSSLECDEDEACVPLDTGVPCDGGNCECNSCPNEFIDGTCPDGCQGPLDDFRNCNLCVCDVCPS